MTVLPGMPPPPDPDATKGCKYQCIRGMVVRDDNTSHACPTHNAKAFEKWAKGQYPGWRDAGTEARKASL